MQKHMTVFAENWNNLKLDCLKIALELNSDLLD